ncbi:MAG: hypothetical protein WAM96_12245, partial [Candidatus Acidiferrales bacterium]
MLYVPAPPRLNELLAAPPLSVTNGTPTDGQPAAVAITETSPVGVPAPEVTVIAAVMDWPVVAVVG